MYFFVVVNLDVINANIHAILKKDKNLKLVLFTCLICDLEIIFPVKRITTFCFSGAKKKPYLTSEQFVKFLNNEQRDPRLNEILYPYFSQKQALDLIHQYETKPSMSAKGNYQSHISSLILAGPYCE